MNESVKSERLIKSFCEAGIDPKIFTDQLKNAMLKSITPIDKSEKFNTSMFKIYAERLIVLLGFS